MLQQNHHHHIHNSSHHQVVSSPHPSTTAGAPTGNLIANPNNQGVQFYNQPYSLISINQLKQQQPNNQAQVHTFNPAPVNSGVNSQLPVTVKPSGSSVNGQLQQQKQQQALQGSNNLTALNEIDSDDSVDTDDEELDEINRTERHVYVTFDVTNQAAQLLKKLATDNFDRLREIGIRSVKLKSEPETIKIAKRLKRESIVSSQNHDAANNTNLQPVLPPQQQLPKDEPLTMPNQTMVAQQLPLVNPSVNPTTKKRNRKTINELTSSPNYLEASQQQKMSIANYQQQHTHHVPSQGSVDTNRNLKLEESLMNLQNKPQSTEAENSKHPQQHTIQQQYHQQQQPHQPKQFYQIDKDGNVVAHTANSNIIQINPANQKQPAQLPQQQPQPIVVAQQNYPNNPANMTNNRGPYNQYANQPGQNLIQQQQLPLQQQMHRSPTQQPGMQPQPQSQQYRMPSPMLANLLSNSSSPQIAPGNDMYNNGSMSVPNSTQPNNNNPVMIRQMSNNYEYVNTNNVNSMNAQQHHHQQQTMNYQGQPQQSQNNDALKQQQPDFNLMKSEDYKHIYQMRQQFASQAGPNQHNQQHMLNQNATMPVVPTGSAVLSPVAGPATTAAAAPGSTPTKRKRAPADPNKPKTKRAKANATAGLIRVSFRKILKLITA